jgi:hypothetical protein
MLTAMGYAVESMKFERGICFRAGLASVISFTGAGCSLAWVVMKPESVS